MKIIILLFSILLLSSYKVKASIESNQYDCLVSLQNNFNIFYGENILNINGQNDYCSSSKLECTNTNPKNILAAYLNSANPSVSIGSNDIICLPYITSMTLGVFNIDDSLYTTPHPTLRFLTISSPTNMIVSNNSVATFTKLSFIFGDYQTSITFPITLFLTVDQLVISGGNVSFSRGPLDRTGSITSLEITSNTIPGLTGIQVGKMNLKIGDYFDTSTLSNYQSWTAVSSVSLFSQSSSNTFDFPYGLLNVGSALKELNTNYQFNQLTQMIDLSSLTGIEIVQFNGGGSKFNFEASSYKNYPISAFPTQQIDFVLSGATFDNIPSFNTFTNPGTVKLFSNTISKTGIPSYQKFSSSFLSITNNDIEATLDSTYCSADLYKMDLSDNGLSGTLPECISCYLGDPVIYSALDGNAFSDFSIPSTPCQSIKPKFELLNSSHVQLSGTNLGFSSGNIVSQPSFTWNMITPSSKFIAEYNNPNNYQKVNITFTIPNKSWIFSLDNTVPPKIDRVVIVGDLVRIIGDFFSEDSSLVSVVIDSIPCDVSDSTFNDIKCIPQSSDKTSTKSLLTLTVNGLLTSVYISLVDGSYASACQLCANDRGVCNLMDGICECYDGYSGDTCGTPVIQCINDCSGHGECDFTTGQCQCEYPWISVDIDDCSRVSCATDCGGSNKGSCDTFSGQCKCVEEWTGSDCLNAAIYANTFSTVPESGGEVQISGWFGPTQDDLIIIIGDLKCNITSFSDRLVYCNIGSGIGRKVANMTSNGVQWKSNNVVFEYISETNNNICSPTCVNGKCVNKICDCAGTGFKGLDCSEPIKNNTPSTGTEVNNNGTSIIYNGKTQYQIYLLSIIEIDILGSTVKEFPLATTWKVIESNSATGRTVFSQSINNNLTQLNFTVEEVSEKDYPNGKTYSFAGESFIVSPNSIKIQFSMINYSYSNSLNSLKLLMQSSVSDDNLDECNNGKSSTETQEQDSTLSYLSISKDNKKMYGRFLDKAIVDDRPTLITTSIYSKNDTSVIVSVNLPHTKNVIIDPDFSVIVTSSFVDSCGDSKKNWLIPVAVVVPVVAISAIIVTTIVILKKNRMTIKLKLNSLNRSMSMRSFKSRD